MLIIFSGNLVLHLLWDVFDFGVALLLFELYRDFDRCRTFVDFLPDLFDWTAPCLLYL